MNTTTLKEKTLKNISYSLVSFAWPMIIAFIVTPVIVRHFGVKEYGIYIFINTLVSLAGILDLGVSTALSKFIAEKRGSGDIQGLKNLFKTANTMLVIIGVTGAVFIISSIFIGLQIFPGDITSSYSSYVPAFIYGGMLFFISSINSLQALIPVSYQRFDIGSKIGVVFITFQQVGILVAVFFNWKINTLFLLQVFLMFVFYFVYKKSIRKILSEEELESFYCYGWNKQEAFRCYKFGLVSSISGLAGVSLTYLDRMIIPIFLGPSNLTFYSLPGSITNKIPSLSLTLSSVIFPMTSYFEGEGDREKTKNLYVRSMRLVTIVSVAITVTISTFAYQMLQYWISLDLANKAANVLVILAVTNLALAVIYPVTSFLLGMGKLKLLGITSTLTAIINGVLLIIFLPRFGIIGAAWAYLLALIPYIYLLYKTERFYLGLLFRKAYYLKFISQLLITSCIVFLIDFYVIKPLITNFLLVIISTIMSCFIFIVTHYLLGFFEKEDSHDILFFIKQRVHKYK